MLQVLAFESEVLATMGKGESSTFIFVDNLLKYFDKMHIDATVSYVFE